MTTTAENNKRIAKNTLLLYFRMLLTMVVSLYTSRIVLQALGVDDFGIYNVVGGVVAMFNVLSGSLSSAISRFITFELGKNDSEKLKRVFSTSLTIQIILAVIIAVVAEIVGIWFINEKMNIAAERLNAANWVFHFSVLTFIVNLISVPYNATIVAHERMSAFAYISILEVFGKLLIAFFIAFSPIDRLVFYAILMFIIALIIRFVYSQYCRRNFFECKYSFLFDKQLVKQMFSFAGWSFVGSMASVTMNQGLDVLLNLFFGPAINAARAIAVQVQNALYSFTSNFQVAVNPQIIKYYSAGEINKMHSLLFYGSKFSYYLLFVLAIPFVFDIDNVLSFWLKEVPDYTAIFFRLIIVISFINSLANSLQIAAQATGKIKKYQLVLGVLQLSILPLSYFYFKFISVDNPEVVFQIQIIILFIAQIVRIYFIYKMVKMNLNQYMFKVIWPIIKVSSTTLLVLYLLKYYLFDSQGVANFISYYVISVLIIVGVIVSLGLTSGERSFLYKSIFSLINKYKS